MIDFTDKDPDDFSENEPEKMKPIKLVPVVALGRLAGRNAEIQDICKRM